MTILVFQLLHSAKNVSPPPPPPLPPPSPPSPPLPPLPPPPLPPPPALPPLPPALRPLLLCLISDYVRIERNLSLCLLSTRNICVFALSCVIYFNVAMMMLVFATVALRQFRVPPPSSSPVMLCVKFCNNRTERVLAAAVYTKHNLFFFSRGLVYSTMSR